MPPPKMPVWTTTLSVPPIVTVPMVAPEAVPRPEVEGSASAITRIASRPPTPPMSRPTEAPIRKARPLLRHGPTLRSRTDDIGLTLGTPQPDCKDAGIKHSERAHERSLPNPQVNGRFRWSWTVSGTAAYTVLSASVRRRFRFARGRVGRARKRGSPGACRRRTRSRSRERSPNRFPTPCSGWSSRTDTTCWPTSRGRCGCTTSGSCQEIGCSWSCRRTT